MLVVVGGLYSAGFADACARQPLRASGLRLRGAYAHYGGLLGPLLSIPASLHLRISTPLHYLCSSVRACIRIAVSASWAPTMPSTGMSTCADFEGNGVRVPHLPTCLPTNGGAVGAIGHHLLVGGCRLAPFQIRHMCIRLRAQVDCQMFTMCCSMHEPC